MFKRFFHYYHPLQRKSWTNQSMFKRFFHYYHPSFLRKSWTADEVQLLRDNQSLKVAEVAKLFPDRTFGSVNSKIYDLKVCPVKEIRTQSVRKGFWTAAEDALLKEKVENWKDFKSIPWSNIADELGRSANTTRQRWKDVLSADESSRTLSDEKRIAISQCILDGELSIIEIAQKFQCPAKKVYHLRYKLMYMNMSDNLPPKDLPALLDAIQGYLKKGMHFIPWTILSKEFQVRPRALQKTMNEHIVQSLTPKNLWDSKDDKLLTQLIQNYVSKGLPIDWEHTSTQLNRSVLQVYFRYSVLKNHNSRYIQLTTVPADFSCIKDSHGL